VRSVFGEIGIYPINGLAALRIDSKRSDPFLPQKETVSVVMWSSNISLPGIARPAWLHVRIVRALVVRMVLRKRRIYESQPTFQRKREGRGHSLRSGGPCSGARQVPSIRNLRLSFPFAGIQMTQLLHPRLSLSAVATFDWTFEQDLEFWSRAGLRCVGLSDRKFAAVGSERVVTELKRRNFAISCIVSGPFTLLDSSAWEAERESMFRCIDIVHALGGGAVYGPPGKGNFDSWDDNAASYAEAVAPCIAYGASRGVRVAFEPTLRPQISFVHNIRDSLDLVERSGAAVVIDVGNCYPERDVREWIRRAGEHIGLVQISDVAIGTMEKPGAGTRGLPGSGELPLQEFLGAAMEAGYAGPFEIEYLGLGEVDQPAVLASLAQMSALLYSLGA